MRRKKKSVIDMKAGFGLLDVLVALTVGSILSVLVYRSIEQINRSVRSMEETTQMQSTRALFESRFDDDIGGAFVPRAAFEEVVGKKPASAPAPTASVGIKNKPTDKSAEKKGDKKAVSYKLNDAFRVENFSVGQGKAISDKSVFTFITSNPLIAYGETTARFARIAYVFQKQESTRIKLVRYESPELDYKKFGDAQKSGKLHGYTVLENINEFELTFGVATEEKEEKQDKAL